MHTIIQTRSGHESQTDDYLDIFAQTADPVYTRATVSGALAAGHTPTDAVNYLESDSNRLCNGRGLILLGKSPARIDHAAARRRDISLTLAM